MITKIKQVWNNALNSFKGTAPARRTAHTSSPAVAPVITQMIKLRDAVASTDAGYSRALNDQQQQYIIAEDAYQDAFQAFTELNKQYRLGLISEATLIAEAPPLKPLEEAVQEAGHELDTIQRYKVEEMSSLLTEMVQLQPEYLKAKSSELNALASELNHMKLIYQQRFKQFNAGCADVFETDKFVSHYFHQYSIHTSDNMGEVFASMVKHMPSSFD